MKTIKIHLPAEDIKIKVENGITEITYMGIYAGRPKGFVYMVMGEFSEFELNDNLLTLK